MKTHNCQQGSTEWFQARRGVISASEIDALVTPLWKVRTGEGVQTYLHLLDIDKAFLVECLKCKNGTSISENVNCISINRDRAYFEMACERISRAQAQGTLLPPEETRQPVQEGLL